MGLCECEEMELLLSARLDGALTEEEAIRLETHLAQCSNCRAFAEELEAIHLAMEQLSADPPVQLLQRIMSELGPQAQPSCQKSKKFPPRFGSVAFVEPARTSRRHKKTWMAWGGMAAALFLILAGVRFLPLYTNIGSSLPMAQYNDSTGGAGSSEGESIFAPASPDLFKSAPDAAQAPQKEEGSSLSPSPENSRNEADASPADNGSPTSNLLPSSQPEDSLSLNPQGADFTGGDSTPDVLSQEEALELVAGRIYGSSGQSGERLEDGSLRVVLIDGEEEVDLGILSYSGLSSDGCYYLFAWTWDGQTPEQAALFQYAVPLNGGEVLWKGEAEGNFPTALDE